MSGQVFDDLASFISACVEIGEGREISEVDWHLELGALVEATAELIPEPPLLLFDRLPGHPAGYRVVSLLLASRRRGALALGLPPDRPKLELVRLAARKLQEARPIPPVVVRDGPVMENVLTGDAVDLWRFPTPFFHSRDGGRYLGSGCVLINQDPDSGYVNLGTYRMQVHERALLGLWISPGQQGRTICQRYWERGESCPVVATFGQDPLTFLAGMSKIPWGTSELDYVGGLRGRPLAVVDGPVTGLPIPACAEIAIEGEVPPPQVAAREEGPYGEWTGYYAGGTGGTGQRQPVIQVKALYHREHPIVMDEAPLWPGAPQYGLPILAGMLWDQLEKAGIPGVVGVDRYNPYMIVIAIRQQYPGHARQAGHAAVSCAAGARDGRYVVVVDEDIDPSSFKEVMWAMQTRVDPATDIELVDSCWSTPLDPRMPPAKRSSGDYTNSRALFYAVRPYHWKSQFPEVSRTEPELRRRVVEKYRSLLSFPPQVEFSPRPEPEPLVETMVPGPMRRIRRDRNAEA
jgi:4-hydroxy-3-polyprenylbenzoate decarboxylase